MLTELKKLEKLLQTLQKQLPKIVEKAVNDEEQYFFALNHKQLLEGKFPDGNETPHYKQSTLTMKRNDPKRTLLGTGINYSLYDRGDLYPEMKILLKEYVLTIYSTSQSTKLFDGWCKQNYGYGVDRFFGLSEENTNIILNKIVENIKEQISELFNGVR